jgi:hypothetical protein
MHKSFQFKIKNSGGQIDLWILQTSLTTDTPNLSNYGDLTWDGPAGKGLPNGFSLPPGTVSGEFTVTFTVHNDAPIGDISFDVIIQAFDSQYG